MCLDELGCVDLNRVRLSWVRSGCVELGSVGICWVWLDYVRLGWGCELVSVGLTLCDGWVELT